MDPYDLDALNSNCYVDLCPESVDQIHENLKREFVNKSPRSISKQSAQILLNSLDELSSIEIAQLFPMFMKHALLNQSDGDFQYRLGMLSLLTIEANSNRESEFFEELTKDLTHITRNILIEALSEVIRLNVCDEEAANVSYPLARIKRYLFTI